MSYAAYSPFLSQMMAGYQPNPQTGVTDPLLQKLMASQTQNQIASAFTPDGSFLSQLFGSMTPPTAPVTNPTTPVLPAVDPKKKKQQPAANVGFGSAPAQAAPKPYGNPNWGGFL